MSGSSTSGGHKRRRRLPEHVMWALHGEMRMTSHGNSSAGGEGKTALMARYAAEWAMNPKTLYRHYKKWKEGLGLPRAWSVRSDAGSSVLTAKQVEELELIKLQCGGLPDDLVLRKAQARGILTQAVSPSTYGRRARALGFRNEQGFRRLETSRPNEIHAVDTTGSAWFQAIKSVVRVDDNGDEVVDYIVQVRFNKNTQPAGFKRKGGMNLWNIGLTDDFSGVRYGQYVVGKGESAYLVMRVLEQAWRGDPEVPFMHLPHVVNMDHGPFHKLTEAAVFMEALGVGFVPREPKEKHVGGKIERTFRVLKERFEQTFADQPGRQLLLSELNEQLRCFLIEENQRQHRRFSGRTRAEMYAHIVSDESIRRLPEEKLTILAYRPFTRTVNRYAEIQFEGRFYKVDWRLVGKEVTLFRDMEGNISMQDPLDEAGTTVFLKEGQRTTLWFDSQRSGDKWEHKYRPESYKTTVGRALREKRDREDGEGWPVGERVFDATGTPVLPVDRDRAEMSSPTVEAKRQQTYFRTPSEAKMWAATELRMPLGQLSPEARADLDVLLGETLERGAVAEWVEGVRRESKTG